MTPTDTWARMLLTCNTPEETLALLTKIAEEYGHPAAQAVVTLANEIATAKAEKA